MRKGPISYENSLIPGCKEQMTFCRAFTHVCCSELPKFEMSTFTPGKANYTT